MNTFKVLIIRFLFVFLLRFLVYSISILPLCYVLAFQENGLTKLFLILVSVLICPFLIILISGIVYAITPDIKLGTYPVFSLPYVKWLFKDLTANIVISSSILNNIANRVDFIKIVFYRLLGVKNTKYLIIASDVYLLDINRFVFHNAIFIGTSTVISGHSIKNGKLVLTMGSIGNNVKIGAFCRIAQGVKIGDNTIIGFGVNIGSNCIIGNNVVIHDAAMLDENIIIEDNSVIGKKCLIGKKVNIKKKSYIGNYSSIGSKVEIKENSKISELSVIKQSVI